MLLLLIELAGFATTARGSPTAAGRAVTAAVTHGMSKRHMRRNIVVGVFMACVV